MDTSGINSNQLYLAEGSVFTLRHLPEDLGTNGFGYKVIQNMGSSLVA